MDKIIQLSLKKQCELIQSGALTSKVLTEKYIDRVRLRNPELNIVVKYNFSAACKRANELDDILAATGKPIGPLHGIPFTIKDAFRIDQFATSYGFPGFNLLPSFSNCQLVERLIQAGAICIGLSNVPLSCFDWQTNSPIYGLTKNPHNIDYTVGGSSGGSAASVAALFTPFEIGSDIAGSIRYPAHCCGVFGLRPSHGLVPFNDIGPAIHKESFKNFAVAGPMARSIEDVQLILSVVADSPINRSEKKSEKKNLKVAYSNGWSGISGDTQTEKLIESFLEKLKTDKHTVDPFTPEIDFAECENVFGIILGYEYKKLIPLPIRTRPFIDMFNYFFNKRRFHEGHFKDNFEKGLFANKRIYEEALLKAEALRNQFHQCLTEYDLWLTPVSPSAAIRHQKTGTAIKQRNSLVPYTDFLGNFLISTALFHHPILTVPIGINEQMLPIGIQLHGKPGEDWQLLSNAELFNDHYWQNRENLF